MVVKRRSVGISESTRDEIMLFKIKSKAKNLDAVIKLAMKALKANAFALKIKDGRVGIGK